MQYQSVLLAVCAAIISLLTYAVPASAQTNSESPQPSSQLAIDAPIRFKDVSKFAGIVYQKRDGSQDVLNGVHYPRVQAWGDFNNDQWIDLYLIRSADDGKLFVNNRDGTFSLSPLTEELKLTPSTDSESRVTSLQRGATWVDYNNDGWSDLYVIANGDNLLFENQWGQGFVEVAANVGLDDTAHSGSSAWGDFNQDGYLDLFIANGACIATTCAELEEGAKSQARGAPQLSPRLRVDKLFQSNGMDEKGQVTFKDVSSLLTYAKRTGPGQDTSFVDFDFDGDLDIYVANAQASAGSATASSGDMVWRNDGSGCGGWCWKIDSDTASRYRNEIAQKSSNSSEAKDANAPENLGEATLNPMQFPLDSDLNNNGFGDSLPAKWNINIANQPTIATADYDQDGWLDLVAGYQGGQHRLFHNIGAKTLDHAWLNLRLIGDGQQVNRDAVGAHVALTTDDGKVMQRTVQIESKRGSSSSNLLHFGLGKSKIKSLQITWPNGKETELPEDAFFQQDTTFTWQIYYPVDVLEQIGGDIIAAEEGEGLEEEQALRDRFNNVTNGQSSAGSLDSSDNASSSENIDGMEDDDSTDSSETARDEDGATSP